MSKNRFELHPDRLATTDETGKRIYLYPEDVKGPWKNLRHKIYWFLILIYVAIPWITIQGKPLLLLNIFTREFTIFGQTFFGVEPLLVFALLAAFIFFIGFVTSIWGRIWCGYACPQTVFIQAVYLKVEKWIEGSARERRELDLPPMSGKKLFKKIFKWGVYYIISLHLAHTFLGYFIGSYELLHISLKAPSENYGMFLFVQFFTGLLLFDFGWFREQFCIIMCPYGRLQSVMMDEKSLVVAYDYHRGEPRRHGQTEVTDIQSSGDCINCYHCVKVCPTGIDIRRGTQLECIACTNCIDACDDIMEKIQKPKGLIRYTTENDLKQSTKTRSIPFRFWENFTARPKIYLTISIGIFIFFLSILSQSTNLKVQFIRNIGAPFLLSEGSERGIINTYQIKLTHQGDHEFDLSVEPNLPEFSVVAQKFPWKLTRAEVKRPFIIKFHPEKVQDPKSYLGLQSKEVTLSFFDHSSVPKKLLFTEKIIFVGPVNFLLHSN